MYSLWLDDMVCLKSHAGKRSSVRRRKRHTSVRRTTDAFNVKRRVAILEGARQRQKKSRILNARREAIARYVLCLRVISVLPVVEHARQSLRVGMVSFRFHYRPLFEG